MAFSGFDHQNLRERLAGMLRDAICPGKLTSGDRLAGSQLAKDMPLMQPSIREGLQVLEHRGLITRIPGSVCLVTKLTSKDKLKIPGEKKRRGIHEILERFSVTEV